MLNTWQNVVIVILILLFAMLFKTAVNRLWTPSSRRTHNDLIGWQISILGTTYAVILGFMLYTVWTNFGVADLNADSEANAAVDVYRVAEGLPVQQRTALQDATRSYVEAVIDHDYPMMAIGGTDVTESRQINEKMWHILMSVKAASATEITAEDHAISELSDMGGHRRIRQLESTSKLPTVLWCVLIIGGAVTIMSSCMFGAESNVLHGLQVFAFSLLLALVLVAIADIDRPFQGSVHVSDAAFRRALTSMKAP